MKNPLNALILTVAVALAGCSTVTPDNPVIRFRGAPMPIVAGGDPKPFCRVQYITTPGAYGTSGDGGAPTTQVFNSCDKTSRKTGKPKPQTWAEFGERLGVTAKK